MIRIRIQTTAITVYQRLKRCNCLVERGAILRLAGIEVGLVLCDQSSLSSLPLVLSYILHINPVLWIRDILVRNRMRMQIRIRNTGNKS
jgi:hypothetical protein